MPLVMLNCTEGTDLGSLTEDDRTTIDENRGNEAVCCVQGVRPAGIVGGQGQSKLDIRVKGFHCAVSRAPRGLLWENRCQKPWKWHYPHHTRSPSTLAGTMAGTMAGGSNRIRAWPRSADNEGWEPPRDVVGQG